MEDVSKENMSPHSWVVLQVYVDIRLSLTIPESESQRVRE